MGEAARVLLVEPLEEFLVLESLHSRDVLENEHAVLEGVLDDMLSRDYNVLVCLQDVVAVKVVIGVLLDCVVLLEHELQDLGNNLLESFWRLL